MIPRGRPGAATVAAALAFVVGGPAAAGPGLSIRHEGAWRQWWRADDAPTRWAGPAPRVTHALAWRSLSDGWATVRLAGAGPAWRTQLIVVGIDPRRVRLSLEMEISSRDGRPAWTIDHAPAGALLAVNAGQFLQTMPWGWLVMDGRQRLSPGAGPLSTALAVDAAGAIRWIPGDSLRPPPPGIRTAFQSYPSLLVRDGRIPDALLAHGRGVDLTHRDARLAIGQTREGKLLIALTRFAPLGGAAEQVPIGPTTPEMAAIMGALGSCDAVMLDGGISAQMLLRDPRSGRRWRWAGLRKVPLGLIVRPRER